MIVAKIRSLNSPTGSQCLDQATINKSLVIILFDFMID